MSMGFYVNLEMPKDCPMCPFAHYDMFNTFCGCDITRGKRWAMKNDKDYAESSTRPDWCNLIEVPEPHGRLIDADRLKESLDSYVLNTQCHYKLTEALVLVRNELLDKASTVIPASERAE